MVVGLVKMLGRLQQGFGRNATDVGAGAAGGGAAVGIFPFVDTSHVHAELGSADGGDVAARACTDDDHVKCFEHKWVFL